MSKQYSIADARRNLPTVVDEAVSGAEVQLTRRGKPVAVLVSVEEFDRLRTGRATFAEAYREFRVNFPKGSQGIGPEYFRSLRDRAPGRKVHL